MSDAVNSISGGAAVAPIGQPVVRPPVVTQDATNTTDNSPIKTLLAKNLTQPAPLTGRLFDDPLAGVVVTQQLDGEGQVVQQTPASSVLAYLRNGLTVEGYPKESKTA